MLTLLVDGYFRILKIVIALFLVAMVALVFGNVVLRYALNSGISVSEEISRWFFVWLVFLGAIVGMREHAHLGVDSLVKALPPAGKRICFVLSHGLMLYACLLLTKGSWEQMLINWDVAAPASGLSTAIFYAAGLAFGVSVTVILAIELYQALAGRLGEAELIAVKESEDH